jgi:transposase-like protein
MVTVRSAHLARHDRLGAFQGGSPMTRQPNLEKQQFWLDHIQRREASGLSVRVYCQTHHINETNFHSWRRTLAERGLLPPAKATPAPIQPTDPTPSTPVFVPITLANTNFIAPAIEFVCPDGLCVRVAAGSDAATLRQLLTLLRENPSC